MYDNLIYWYKVNVLSGSETSSELEKHVLSLLCNYQCVMLLYLIMSDTAYPRSRTLKSVQTPASETDISVPIILVTMFPLLCNI